MLSLIDFDRASDNVEQLYQRMKNLSLKCESALCQLYLGPVFINRFVLIIRKSIMHFMQFGEIVEVRLKYRHQHLVSSVL